MGNRAVITAATSTGEVNKNAIGVYIHWHGGRDSVQAFLVYCKLKGYRTPDMDNYGWARLCQVIGNFFGGESSIGIDTCSHLDCDNLNNGVYFIRDWEIVGRQYFEGREQNEYKLKDMLIEINNRQPKNERLTLEQIESYLKTHK